MTMRLASRENVFLVQESTTTSMNDFTTDTTTKNPSTSNIGCFPTNKKPSSSSLETRELWWRGFLKRHAWLSPFFGPYSAHSSRPLRVVIIFTLICGNMGMSSILFMYVGSLSGFILVNAIVSALIVSTIVLFVELLTVVLTLSMMRRRRRRRSPSKSEPQESASQGVSVSRRKRFEDEIDDDNASHHSWTESRRRRHQYDQQEMTRPVMSHSGSAWQPQQQHLAWKQNANDQMYPQDKEFIPIVVPTTQEVQKWRKRIPLLVIGLIGAGFSVHFNSTASGLINFFPWIISSSIAILVDILVIQTCWAMMRVNLSIFLFYRAKRRMRRQQRKIAKTFSTSASSKSATMTKASAVQYYWQHGDEGGMNGKMDRNEIMMKKDDEEEDLMLMDAAIADAASVETDVEARELLDFIFFGHKQQEDDDDQGQEERKRDAPKPKRDSPSSVLGTTTMDSNRDWSFDDEMDAEADQVLPPSPFATVNNDVNDDDGLFWPANV